MTALRWKRERDWDNRNLQIVAMRLDKLTYKEIGDHFGISGNRVRQIVYRHMNKCRNNEVFLSMAAKQTIRRLLSEHTPIEVLRLKGVGMKTYGEIKDWMAAGGAELGGRWK
jgi:DNA-binding CsgD family transcriptional regulator